MSSPEHGRPRRHNNRSKHGKGVKKPRRNNARRPDRRQAGRPRKSSLKPSGWISLDEACGHVMNVMNRQFKRGIVYAVNDKDAAGQIARKADLPPSLVCKALRYLRYHGMVATTCDSYRVVAIDLASAA